MQINDKKTFNLIILAAAIILLMYTAVRYLPEILAGLGYLLRLIKPFIIGLAIAFILNVFVDLIEKYMKKTVKDEENSKFVKKFMRPLSLVMSIGILIGSLAILLFLIIPELRRTAQIVGESFPDYIDNIVNWYNGLSSRLPIDLPQSDISSFELSWDRVNEMFSGFLQRSGSIFSATLGITTSIIGVIVNLSLGFVFAVYILLQKEKLAHQTRRLLYAFLPVEKVDRILSVSILSHRIFSSFVTGELLEAMILGTLCFLGMIALSFPYATVIGVLIGFTALIPIFGAFFGTGIGALLILTVDPMQALWFIVFILVLQQIDGNFIYPNVVGHTIGLPSIWVLAAVTIGGGSFGILGMILGVPIVSIFYTLLGEAINRRLARKNLTDCP